MVRLASLRLSAVLPLFAGPLGAQLPAAGERDPSGRIMTKIIVTMTEPGAFGRPVAAVAFLVVAEDGDRITVRTNDAGVASTWLRPGMYRIVNPDAVPYAGKAYTWDITAPIRAGSGSIRLSQSNASRIISLGPEVQPAPIVPQAATPRPVRDQGVRV